MSRFQDFSHRYHSLRETMQRQEEVQLARVTEEEQVILRQMEVISQERRTVMAACGRQRTGAEAMAWHQFARALEQREAEHLERLQEAKERVAEQRQRVMTAYRESRRWETLVERLDEGARVEADRLIQREADEAAAQRRGHQG